MDDIQIQLDELSKALTAEFEKGRILDDSGQRLFIEKAFKMGRYRVHFYPDEGKHRGRPHCVIELPNNKVAKVDIVTGVVIEGDTGGWDRSIRKFASEYSAELKQAWAATRPDTQKLPKRPST